VKKARMLEEFVFIPSLHLRAQPNIVHNQPQYHTESWRPLARHQKVKAAVIESKRI